MIRVLAIETSCDETAVAVVENGTKVVSNVISSQIDLHKKFGGVVPEIASRMHTEQMNLCIRQALDEMTLDDIDVIGVTYGPGLVGALLVGVMAAKAIAFAKNIPLVGVNHIKGHIAANYIEHPQLKPPFLCLVVSGGHTHLVNVKDYTEYEIVGRTKDDAVGEAYDKVARTLGLKYPGGPKIDELAKVGDKNSIDFPRAMLDGGYDFSFSGVKSSVLNYVNGCNMKQQPLNAANVAASFQQAVVDVLTYKTINYATANNIKNIALAGGVACNSGLRQALTAATTAAGINLYYPQPLYCTDNAVMIGVAAYYEYLAGSRADMHLNAVANLAM
ncbi:MAG: tRNA (adenosine(37)-N6)-threonylcarbamoyltransferase complex transferase subunit TsaD [Epulopiscium sp. Nuni2H_MBin001]|nr:MAG: tRNA (adenosine(37)-N6)-threonylcarbamoyltransferase complex transferase subunit TsaD [Epulopiscium sp. Nuni2H_MBin001]